EMDYMVNNAVPNGLAPNQNVIDGIIDVFENADVSNPDGSMGIDIYLELSNQVPLDLDLNPYAAEFYAIKGNAANFNVERTILFHYMIWANAYGGGTSSGVSMGIPAADFIVTLGPAWGVVPDGYKIGTFVHELGHNLNLTHGGAPGDHG